MALDNLNIPIEKQQQGTEKREPTYDQTTHQILHNILIQLAHIRLHLSAMSGIEVDSEDVQELIKG